MAFNNDAFLKRTIDPNILAQLQAQQAQAMSQPQVMPQSEEPDTSEFDSEPTQTDMNELSSQAPEVTQPEINQAATPEVPQAYGPPTPEAPPKEKTAKELLQERLDQEKANRQQAIELSQKALAQQNEGLTKNESYLKALKQKDLGLDLAPFLAYVDSQTGSNLLKGYKPPQTEDERRKEINDLEKALQAERKDYSKEVIGLVKAQQDKGKNDRNDRLVSKDLYKSFTDPIKDMDSVGNTMNRLESAFTPDKDGTISYMTIQSNIIPYVRSVGGEKGPLSDNDVARSSFTTAESILAKLASRIGEGGRVSWTDPSVQEILYNVNAGKRAAYAGFKNKLDTAKNYYLRLPGYMDYSDAIEGMHQEGRDSLDRAFASKDFVQSAKETINTKYGKKQASTQTKKAAPTQEAGPSLDEIAAEKERRKKGIK